MVPSEELCPASGEVQVGSLPPESDGLLTGGHDMSSVVVNVPGMYADHHVVEVRRILLQMPGVTAVYASSAFGIVEIGFDAEGAAADGLVRCLAEAGYVSELPTPMESGDAASDSTAAGGQYRRFSTTRAAAGTAVAFRREPARGTPPASTGERPADAKDE